MPTVLLICEVHGGDTGKGSGDTFSVCRNSLQLVFTRSVSTLSTTSRQDIQRTQKRAITPPQTSEDPPGISPGTPEGAPPRSQAGVSSRAPTQSPLKNSVVQAGLQHSTTEAVTKGHFGPS